MLKFKKVTKRFGKTKALDDASFEIKKGDFVFFVGHSGAGKTTILKLLMGDLKSSSGDIIFDGKSVGSFSKRQLPFLRRKIGAVFQNFRLLDERTVRENIETALAIKGINPDEWEGKVDKVLKMVGIGDKAELFPAQLSGGEMQRAAIARALVMNPKILFADEPTGNLDWETAESIMALFEEINKKGKTVVIATHHKGIINEHKHRVIELKNGKVVRDSGGSNK